MRGEDLEEREEVSGDAAELVANRHLYSKTNDSKRGRRWVR